MVPDAGVSELILPVCDQLGEDDLAAALGRLAARPEQLSVVQLGFCGHGLTPAVAALSSPPVRAATCTRCASPAASRPPRSWRCARRARREGLRVLQLSGNSQLAAPGLAALGAHCGGPSR